MSGLFGFRLLDFESPEGQAVSRRKLAAIGHDLHRGRIFAIPWYEMGIVGTHGFANMSRAWPGGVALQGIVAPVDLALIAYGHNFRGTKTGGTMTIRLQIDGVNSQYPTRLIDGNADHGYEEVDFEADVIPQGTVWTIQNSTAGFTPGGSIDVEVFAYLAPV